MRPRLERSLADDPGRVAALLTWAWARIPELLGDAVDLTDHERVAAIVAAVELHEFGPPAPAAPGARLEGDELAAFDRAAAAAEWPADAEG